MPGLRGKPFPKEKKKKKKEKSIIKSFLDVIYDTLI
jgi:hypothetical protein